jgi:hypothetical protein
MTAPPDSIVRSTALLEAAGFAMHPIRDVWHLVAHTAQHPGLMLVSVFAGPPDLRNPRLGLPGGYHPGTRRLIHCWKADAALPEALEPVGDPLPAPSTGPPDRPHSVRTVTPPSLLGSPCPVCKERLLRGRQTVCSGRCRAKRWRDSRTSRDPALRAALEEIVRLAQVTLGRLGREGPQ